jgi:hypothetical protein
MSRSVRGVAAFSLTAVLVGAGLVAASPAAAFTARSLPPGVDFANAGTLVDPDYLVDIDCSLIPDDVTYDYDTQFDYADLPIPADGVVTVSVLNCVSVELYSNSDDPRVTPQYTPLDGPDAGEAQVFGTDWESGDIDPLTATEYEVGPNTEFIVLDGDDPTGYFVIDVELLIDVADPQGDRVDELDLTIPGDADADMVVADDPQYYDEFDDLELGGVTDCGITDGNHFWASSEVVVETRGFYSFRVSDLDPISSDVDFRQPDRYMTDPFLALYSTFDPANAHLGVVGCNDDSDLDDYGDYYLTSSGTVMSDRYSQFTIELQPGTYTLVLTSYDDESEFDVTSVAAAAATPGDALDDTKGGVVPAAFGEDETGTVEIWFEASSLAATGASEVNGGMLAAGLALMTLGGLALTTRRSARSA